MCSLKLSGLITWSVCRQDVRNHLVKGDVVIFFATDDEKDLAPSLSAKYYFIGFATVKEKIRHIDIWNNNKYLAYRQYKNHLIRKEQSGYCHNEPLKSPGEKLHKDWLWRIIKTKGIKGRKKNGDLLKIEQNGIVRSTDFIGGKPIPFADNYIIFEDERRKTGEGFETFILKEPIIVAEAVRGDTAEKMVG